MGRKPWFDKIGMKKGAWSQEEDDKLRAYILRYGHWNWRQLPKFAGRILYLFIFKDKSRPLRLCVGRNSYLKDNS